MKKKIYNDEMGRIKCKNLREWSKNEKKDKKIFEGENFSLKRVEN